MTWHKNEKKYNKIYIDPSIRNELLKRNGA